MGTIIRGLLVLLVGAAALVLATWFALEQGRFLATAERAPGTVVKLNAGGSHPEIQFTTPDGQQISFPQGGLIFGYREGMPVSVLFDPASPGTSAVINDVGAIWGRPILFGGVGAFLFLGGLWTVWLGARNHKRGEQ